MEPFNLETERLFLANSFSEFCENDINRIVESCNDPLTTTFLSRIPKPYTSASALEFIKSKQAGWQKGDVLQWFVITKSESKLIASIEARQNSTDHSVGIWLHPDSRKKGYAAEAVRCVADWISKSRYSKALFPDGRIGLIDYSCAKGNIASAKVAMNAGFVFDHWEKTDNPARYTVHNEPGIFSIYRFEPENTLKATDFPSLFTTGRIGYGFDVHPFAPKTSSGLNLPLRLGLLEFSEFEQLQAHSDGDVVAHALADAMLSAAGLADIGEIFGENLLENTNISGTDVLKTARNLVFEQGFELYNASVNIVAEKPRISERRSEMNAALSLLLFAPVTITASTGNGCVPYAKNGIGATATVLLRPL